MVHHKLLLGPIFVLLFCLLPLYLGATSLLVRWTANTESDLSGYLVYVGNASGRYTSCTDVGKTTSYQIRNVTPGKAYYVALTAYDTSGNESGYSAEVRAVVPASTVPTTTPSIRLLSPVAGAVLVAAPQLRWSAQLLTSFSLYLAINGSDYHRIYSGTDTSYSLPPSLWYLFIPSGATIRWYVIGTGSGGRQARSVVSYFKKH